MRRDFLFVFQFFSGDNDTNILIGYGLFENAMPMVKSSQIETTDESNVKLLSQIHIESIRHNAECIKRTHCNVFNEYSTNDWNSEIQ